MVEVVTQKIKMELTSVENTSGDGRTSALIGLTDECVDGWTDGHVGMRASA